MLIGDIELENLLREGESFRVERKESLRGAAASAVREAICAFANDLPASGRPGVVFVGVTDDGRIRGEPITDETLRQLADMKSDGNIVPPPSLLVEKRRLAGGDIAVVVVQPSDSPPVRLRGAIHVRIGPRKGRATAQDERILNEKRRSQDRPFDIQSVPGVGLQALDLRVFDDEYLPAAFAPEVLEANDRTVGQRLAATKMIAAADEPLVTILGLLVLGRRPRDEVPSSYVQFVRYRGRDLADDIVDGADIDGRLSEILRRLDDKLRSHIHTGFDIVEADTERRQPSYPLAALQQLVRNAVMHRTYEATNAPIRISWFDDRIEILSPGGPFGIVTRENFGGPGITDYRNPNLAEAMKVLGYVQRFGVGIATARRLLREAGHPPPEFDADENFVLVTVRGRRR